MQQISSAPQNFQIDFNVDIFSNSSNSRALRLLDALDQLFSKVGRLFPKSDVKAEFDFRPIEASDHDSLYQLHLSLSPESKRFRFNSCLSNTSTRFFRQLAKSIANLQPEQGFGFIAIDKETEAAVGVAYVVFDGEQGGEMALAINDNFQNRGLGSTFFNMLVSHAQQQQLRSLTAYVCIDNVGMRRLISKSGLWHKHVDQSGTLEYLISL